MAPPNVSEVNVMAELQRTAVTSDLAPQPLGAYSVGMSVDAQN